MSHRSFLLAASSAFVVLGLACVDLFHSTDFDTLCTHSPNDPQCSMGTDASNVPDVATVDSADADAGGPPPVDFCQWTSAKAAEEAVHACAWLGACEGPLGEAAFGACVVRARLAFDCGANPSLRPRGATNDFWSCLSSITSCGDVDRCIYASGTVQPCSVQGGGTSNLCGGDRNPTLHLECTGADAGRAQGVEPCVMLGQSCAQEGLGFAKCYGALGVACTTDHCAGTSAITCKASNTKLDVGIDCASMGDGRCIAVGGAVACAAGAIAPSCTADTAPTCDGTVITRCLENREIRVDCTRLGLQCDASQATSVDPAAACTMPAPQPCNAADTCSADGTELSSCGRGALYTVKCATVGLGKCAIAANGNARCAPPP